MDSFEIRREWLRHGGNSEETARKLTADGRDITRQGVHKHVQRANRLQPLIVPTVNLKASVSPEDLDALACYVRASLEAAGITRE